ncbi:ABC transporter substrate-binding protein [Gracilinema caldarium]|uniref:Extracellular solute-binding protein family 1 n=1 Tax=Gracilinema caldarium (strain ATCC 51460 / DSM 7334 / H1) TaxID=744872 RepID=F8F423_GRAC1|nr:ABC transporter substrate-binding protein [Gracilinema caldarium]AEJ20042.1 extracellular solute-binding protein family 1 [Gracilinema caldarium DSM 7334]
MKRIISIVMVLIVGGALVFASGQKETGDGTQSTKPEKIVYWTSMTPPESIVLKEMVDTYNKTHSGVIVEFVQVPGSETDISKLMTAVRGGTGPDVYQLDRFTVAQRAAAGVLEDLTAMVQKNDANLSSKYLPFAWAETQYKGRTYALPFDTDARVLYYNKDMIKAAGFDPEIFNPKNGPLTIDQIKQIAQKIDKTDANGNYTQVGFIPYDTTYSQGWHYTWGFVFGGKFADLNAMKVTPTNPGVVKAFQFMKDWAAMMGPQKVQTFISTYAPPNPPPEQHPFLIGKVSMMVSGDWVLNSIKQYAPNLNYGVTYIPIPEKGASPQTWSGGWSFVIPKGSKHVAAAYDFISWMAGPEGQKMYIIGTSHMPTYKALVDDDALYEGDHKFFKQLLTNSNSRPPLPVGGLYWDALTQAQNAVTLKQADPVQVLQQAYDTVQPQLDQVK